MKTTRLVTILCLIAMTTGCSTAEQVVEKGRGSYSYEELTALPDYESELKATCDPSLNSTVETLSYISLGAGAEASSVADVMRSRTERILKATGDSATEGLIKKEKFDWEESIEGIQTTNWVNPSEKLVETVDASFEENTLSPFYGGDRPKVDSIRELVKADWVEICGLTEKLNASKVLTTDYENAVGALEESFKARYNVEYQDYGVAFVKMKIQSPNIVFDLVINEVACSPMATVRFEGVPDKDGITVAAESQEVLLQHSRAFEPLTLSEKITDFVFNQPKLFDIAGARITDVRCF